MPDLVIGIDASLTGFAMVAINVFTGEVVADDLLKTKPGATTRRYKSIMGWIEVRLRILGPQRIAHICLEDYAREVKWGREESGMLRMAVLLALDEVFGDTEIAYPTLVAVPTLKKYVTGGGKAAKELMLLRTFTKWGIEYSDNNLCDAHGLARMAAALVSRQEPEHKYERECLAAVGRNESWQPVAPPKSTPSKRQPTASSRSAGRVATSPSS